MTAHPPISGAVIGLPTLTRRGLLAAAPALALLPASVVLSAPPPSVKDQIEGHVAALVALLRGCSLQDFPRIRDVWCIERRDGTWMVGSSAFALGEFKSGDVSAHFVDNERWEVQ